MPPMQMSPCRRDPSSQENGSAIALAFAEVGAHLALLDLNEEGLAHLPQEARGKRTPPISVRTAVADLSTEQGVTSGIVEVLSAFENRIDILAANVDFLIAQRFEELTAEQWQRALALNFFTHLYACQAVIP